MSYTRSYNESVTGRLIKTYHVDYPATEHGGTTSITIDEEIEVPFLVNIDVDTDPFDESVQNCNDNVNLLTAAVVATETAEVVSIDHNSKKVAKTIVGGFFSYIRSEISQQIAELSHSVDAQLMHLKELALACMSKKTQMESDFNRIAGRYFKIFDDLNHELSNRVYELDKPAFVFRKETDNQKIRASENDMVNIVAIFGSESGEIQSKISVSIAKKRALDSILKAKIFLWQQKRLNTTIQQCMLNENLSRSTYLPVCLFETTGSGNIIDKNIFSQDYISTLKDQKIMNELIEHFCSGTVKWDNLSPVKTENIRLHFNNELNSRYSQNDQHSVRVREMIQRMAKINSIKAVSF